ncbi:MAG: hypothetical protein WC762_07770 [Methylobacter sp.]
MITTTAVNMDNSYFSNPSIINEQRLNKSSSPSLRLGEVFLKKKEVFTQSTQSKQACVLILVDGQPLVITQNTESQIEKSLDSTNTQPTAAFTESFDMIKTRLALSITQLAELFGVTRKTVYDWCDGSKEPRRTMRNRMEILIEILDRVPAEADLRRLKAVWNIPVSGKSFLAVFCDDKLDPTALRAVLEEKLNELSPRLVATTNSMQKTTSQLGEAHLAEFDRRTDFG